MSVGMSGSPATPWLSPHCLGVLAEVESQGNFKSQGKGQGQQLGLLNTAVNQVGW